MERKIVPSIQYLYGAKKKKKLKKKIHLLGFLAMNNNERTSFFRERTYSHRINRNVKSIRRLFLDSTHF
ncbi:hypothetical protein RYX36_022765, partial [Vicia faba]